jgi:Tfp pilus assembly protein PilN
MIQLNLLPDVKMQYIKAQRQRRLVFSLSILVAAVSVGILLFLLSIDGLQKKHLSDLSSDISSESSELQKKPNIQRILTVQNQLQSLTALHSQKPAASRLFSYLIQLTPSNVNINDMKVDFTQQTISITGTSDTLSNVNKYVDTLKYTSFTAGSDSSKMPAFKNVVLSSFNLNTDTQNAAQAANYMITASYDPAIFDITQKINLAVPSLVTTRTQSGQPTSDLFKPAPSSSTGGGR